jgi:cell wall-associated protease
MALSKLALLVVIVTTSIIKSFAGGMLFQQDTTKLPHDWFLRDPQSDTMQGMSVEKAYSTILKGKASKTVLVAVMDSGIDIDHEDLKGIIWLNEDEIGGNGIDDDKNGYTDDVNGWNFIGGKNGDVNADTKEITREYKRLKQKFGSIEESKIPKKDQPEYDLWKKVKSKYEADSKFDAEQLKQFNENYETYSGVLNTVTLFDSLLKSNLGVKNITRATLDSIDDNNDTLALAKSVLSQIFESIDDVSDLNTLIEVLNTDLTYFNEALDYYQTANDFTNNLEYDSRAIVGDNYANVSEKYYGNNHVQGGKPMHGTHVAGVIGANRKNNVGIKGVADNVKIMAVRVVPPSGDERDKDVANGIYYAVDNGAQIINMSFGKEFSTHKDVVEKAIRYAESKGVLLIHSSGNDGADNDTEANFPNRFYNNKKEANNFIEVGASSWEANDSLVAGSSNYGKKTVDFFAPGVRIYSPEPGNLYSEVDGTSFSSPATAGVAALLMSYFPDLTATQVRDILRQSTRKFDNLKVTKPGTIEKIEFSKLSMTGGIINAYEAVKLASTMSKSIEKN